MDRLAQRENEDCVLNFEAASAELSMIVGAANSTSQRAKHVETEEDKAAWWDERRQQDHRLKMLLENIDLRWLGAFKVSLHTGQSFSLMRATLLIVLAGISQTSNGMGY